MTETQFISKNIRPYLESIGARCFKFHGSAFTESGVPDLLCCINNGSFVAFEIKKKGNEPTPVQCAVMRSIRRAGGKAGVVYTHSYKRDIQDILNGAYDHLV